MLFRSGIPSRLVNGFTSGDYNEYGDYWTVRMKHAHAWVQVYAGNGVWITEDPTPARLESWFLSGYLQFLFEHLNKVSEYFDALWQSSVLYFSRVDQSLFLASILSWWEQSPFANTIVFLISSSILILVLRLFFRSFDIRYRSRNIWARRLDKWLEKKGIIRAPNQGFIELIKVHHFDQDTSMLLNELGKKIYQLEFQPSADPSILNKELRHLWKDLKKQAG